VTRDTAAYRVTSDSGKEILVSMSDVADVVMKSPLLTEAFLRALVNVVPRAIGTAVLEIVVTISDTANQIELERHVQHVHLNAAKLRATTDILSSAVASAQRSDYPAPMRDELVERLYELFYSEMLRVVEGRR
jgi:hypothetical protein